jgi:hypothetical protein
MIKKQTNTHLYNQEHALDAHESLLHLNLYHVLIFVLHVDSLQNKT